MVTEIFKKFEQVQELDLQIDKILRTQAEAPKKLKQFDIDIKTAALKRTETQKKIDDLNKNRRQQQGAIELNEERIKRSQDRLGQIKTNDEYQALQKEIEAVTRQTQTFKDSDSKTVSEISALEEEIKALDSKIKDIESKKNAEQEKIDTENQGLQGELSQLKTKRNEIATGIEAKYIAAYDKTRGSKGGVGVVPIINGVCRGCNMHITPQLYVEIQRLTEVHTCPTCRRFLLYKAPEKSA